MSNENKQNDERAASVTAGMTLAERIAHVGGRENAAGYIEFGSVMAVDALIQHALRDAARATQQATTGDERAEIERCAKICESVMEQSRNHLFRSAAKICAMSIRNPTQPCNRAPEGWMCSRIAGHEGPCAASKITTPSPVAGSAGQAPMSQDPYAYAYEWDTPFGLHRDLQYGTYNGSYPNRTIALYTETPTAPSLATDAGAVLTEAQRETVELAVQHLELVHALAPDGDMAANRIADDLRALLAANPTEQRMSDAVRDAESPVEAFLSEVRAELIRARTKFPGDRIMTIALAEEFGELCKAVLDESAANVRKEAVQTAVMCARVVLDGDGSVTDWRRERGLDQLIDHGACVACRGRGYFVNRDLENEWNVECNGCGGTGRAARKAEIERKEQEK